MLTDFGPLVGAYEAWFEENPRLYEAELSALQVLGPFPKEGLEVGCGTGRFAVPLGLRQGIDPSPEMAALAIARGMKVDLGVVEALPYEAEAFPLLLMVTVDCFLKDLGVAFKEVHRVLKAGGRFVIAFIDKETPLGAVYLAHQHESPFYKNANFHSAEEIESAIKAAGFLCQRSLQTVMSLDNLPQPIKEGTGEGVFAVMEAVKA